MSGEFMKPETYNGNYILFKKAWFGMSVQATAWKDKKVVASAGGRNKEEAFEKIKQLLR